MLSAETLQAACLQALGLLCKEDAKRFECRLRDDRELADEYRALTAVSAALPYAFAMPVAVPDSVKRRVMERVYSGPARVRTDRNGAIVEINSAFTGLCGYTFAELAGRKPGHILQGAGTDPATVEILRAAVREGRACTVEILNYHKNGTPYCVQIALEPIYDEGGALVGFSADERKIEKLSAADTKL